MDSPFFLLLVGLLYIVVFGGLSLLRREGLSIRFALESLVFTAAVSLFAWATGISIHPAIFLLVLYAVTMRVRMVVDIGNAFARQRNFSTADRVYQFGYKLWPDATNQLILTVNKGTLRLQQGALDESIQIFRNILAQSDQGYLGIRYESAAHYNLGVAYHRKGLEAQSIAEFNTVLDIWPSSEYSRAATRAIERHRQSQKEDQKKDSTPE